MPRNVVTLVPRWRWLPGSRTGQDRVRSALAGRYRYRTETDPERIEIDFPNAKGRAAAKDEVAQVLDGIEAKWRRLFVIYPTESALRSRGERR